MSMRFPVRAMLRASRWLVIPVLVVAVSAAHSLRAQGSPEQTRLLRTPTISATQIAFAYANNIWIVERGGGNARRLTSFQGQTTNPHFSPDGKWIAFSGEYAGNTDVYRRMNADVYRDIRNSTDQVLERSWPLFH